MFLKVYCIFFFIWGFILDFWVFVDFDSGIKMVLKIFNVSGSDCENGIINCFKKIFLFDVIVWINISDNYNVS